MLAWGLQRVRTGDVCWPEACSECGRQRGQAGAVWSGQLSPPSGAPSLAARAGAACPAASMNALPPPMRCTPFLYSSFASCIAAQVHFSVVDLELHARYTPNSGESVFDRDQAVAKRTQVRGRAALEGRACSCQLCARKSHVRWCAGSCGRRVHAAGAAVLLRGRAPTPCPAPSSSTRAHVGTCPHRSCRPSRRTVSCARSATSLRAGGSCARIAVVQQHAAVICARREADASALSVCRQLHCCHRALPYHAPGTLRATSATSGRRCSRPTRSRRLRRWAWTTRRPCKRRASSSGTRCWPSGAAWRLRRSSRCAVAQPGGAPGPRGPIRQRRALTACAGGLMGSEGSNLSASCPPARRRSGEGSPARRRC